MRPRAKTDANQTAMTLWIPGPLPGMNEIVGAAKGFGGRGYGYSKMKKLWTDTVKLRALAAKLPKMKRVRLHFSWVEKNQRRDPENIAAAKKFILDGLVEARIIPDDGWSEISGWTDSFVVVSEMDPSPGVWIRFEDEDKTWSLRLDLVQAGCSVNPIVTHDGRAAMLVGTRLRNWLFVQHEAAWHRIWKGQVHVIETVEEALRIMGGAATVPVKVEVVDDDARHVDLQEPRNYTGGMPTSVAKFLPVVDQVAPFTKKQYRRILKKAK